MRLQPRGIILALVLIVLGTPARQVEAASDLARTVAEINEPGRCEEIDGGVGDDQLEAPRPTADAENLGLELGVAEPPGLALEIDALSLLVASERRGAPADSPTVDRATRLARLQRFLF